MSRRVGHLAASVVLPGTGQILRGRLVAGTAVALGYTACWQVLLVGGWLLPEQFPVWAIVLAAVAAGAFWLGGLAWTLLDAPAPPTGPRAEEIDADLRTAVALILQGGYDRAEAKLRDVLRRQRDSAAAWAHLGWLYRCSGAPRRAARAYRRALWFDQAGRFESDLRRELAGLRP